jgi:hypothetical protein
MLFASAHGAVGNRLAGSLCTRLSTMVYRRVIGSSFVIRETGDGGTSVGDTVDFSCSAEAAVSTARRDIFSWWCHGLNECRFRNFPCRRTWISLCFASSQVPSSTVWAYWNRPIPPRDFFLRTRDSMTV